MLSLGWIEEEEYPLASYRDCQSYDLSIEDQFSKYWSKTNLAMLASKSFRVKSAVRSKQNRDFYDFKRLSNQE